MMAWCSRVLKAKTLNNFNKILDSSIFYREVSSSYSLQAVEQGTYSFVSLISTPNCLVPINLQRFFHLHQFDRHQTDKYGMNAGERWCLWQWEVGPLWRFCHLLNTYTTTTERSFRLYPFDWFEYRIDGGLGERSQRGRRCGCCGRAKLAEWNRLRWCSWHRLLLRLPPTDGNERIDLCPVSRSGTIPVIPLPSVGNL